MTIGEMSRLTNLSATTLRYYEKKRLLRVGRDSGGRRDYQESDVDWIKFLKRLKDTGMILRDIEKYAALRYEGDATMPERLEMLISHQKFLTDQKKKWEEYSKNLDEKIRFYEKSIRMKKVLN